MESGSETNQKWYSHQYVISPSSSSCDAKSSSSYYSESSTEIINEESSRGAAACSSMSYNSIANGDGTHSSLINHIKEKEKDGGKETVNDIENKKEPDGVRNLKRLTREVDIMF